MRSGNLIDQANAFVTTDAMGNTVPTKVSGAFFANQLSSELGYPVAQGEAYYTPGCTSTAACVFPNAVIPQAAWSAPAKALLQYVPTPNAGAWRCS